MISLPDQQLFDALLPFSFATRIDGTILRIGRGLRKALPELQEGMRYHELFHSKAPQQPLEPSPRGLLGQGIILGSIPHPSLILRGEVLETQEDGEAYLFAVGPAIRSAQEIRALGLTLSDFRLGEPVIDYLLLSQQQEMASKRLEESNALLVNENKISRALLSLHTAMRDTPLDGDFYFSFVKTLTEGLNCDLGMLFHVTGDASAPRATLADWHVTDSGLFTDFLHASAVTDFIEGETFLGNTIRSGQASWCSDVRDLTLFVRRSALPHNRAISLIQLPISINGKIVSIFEFLKDEASLDRAPERSSLDLIRVTIENLINAKLAAEREREQLAMIVHSSKMATLGEVMAGVAHEVNNPLHSLKLTTTLLRKLIARDPSDTTSLLEQIKQADRALERMTTLVNELKAFSRESSHDTPQPHSIASIISDTLDLCRSRFASEGLEMISSDIHPEWQIVCKPSEISQVVLNLLNNAFDAISTLSTRWISLEVEQKDDSYQISVTDAGERIKDEIANKIMTPFFTTKPLGKGTGLGLSISSNIITKHGGTLTLDRECPNTRFVITLPCYQGGVVPES